eukprot:TRINITY_DN16176_c0_g1_i2.p1 TRINITY_DN16176_c0_g1~~TRINITY_DN16176_c0_g1_i2.p1  ORF type:complete len:457 (+),score=77.92 TRINITY_DN16176_c0_g1_i2:123-1493(+)
MTRTRGNQLGHVVGPVGWVLSEVCRWVVVYSTLFYILDLSASLVAKSLHALTSSSSSAGKDRGSVVNALTASHGTAATAAAATAGSSTAAIASPEAAAARSKPNESSGGKSTRVETRDGEEEPTPLRSKSLCIDGRLAPELQILGSPKAATSSLAEDFRRHGVLWPLRQPQFEGKIPSYTATGAWDGKEKEFEFFIRHDMENENRTYWLAHYPPCPEDGKKKAASMDATPAYMIDPRFTLRRRMGNMYGPWLGRVTFVILLREPVARAYSLYCFFRHRNYLGLRNTSADTYFRKVVKEGQWTGNMFLNSGAYAEQLAKLFQEFNTTQFLIIPWRYYIKPNDPALLLPGGTRPPSVLNVIMDRLHLPIDAASTTSAAVKENMHSSKDPFPPLDQSMPPLMLARYKSYVRARSPVGGVARVLAVAAIRAPHKGPTLFGFHGDPKNVADLKSWLQKGWK